MKTTGCRGCRGNALHKDLSAGPGLIRDLIRFLLWRANAWDAVPAHYGQPGVCDETQPDEAGAARNNDVVCQTQVTVRQANSEILSTTRRCCSSVSPAYIGSERISLAAASVLGKSPRFQPQALYASCKWIGIG